MPGPADEQKNYLVVRFIERDNAGLDPTILTARKSLRSNPTKSI